MTATLDWRVDARCRGTTNPDLFFPDLGGACDLRPLAAVAWRYCQPCPVIGACHLLAERTAGSVGIWGGSYRRLTSSGSAQTVPTPLVPAAPKQRVAS